MFCVICVGILYGLTMFMVSIALVMAVIVTNIYLRKDAGHRVPPWLRRTSDGGALPRLTDEPNHCGHLTTQATKPRDIELDSVSIISVDGRENFRSRVNSNSYGTGSWLANSHRRALSQEVAAGTRLSRPSLLPMMTETELRAASRLEIYGQEWRLLAKRVDRIFFWIFVGSSVGALLAMFLSLPHHNLM